MTRVYLPDHTISYQIAKFLLIDYYIPKMHQDDFTKDAQRRVADYVVEYIDYPPDEKPISRVLYFTPNGNTFRKMKGGGFKVYKDVSGLCEYLNNS